MITAVRNLNGLILCAIVVLVAAGCSTNKKDELPTATPAMAQASPQTRSQNEPRAAAAPPAPNIGDSSLDQLQRGEVGRTAASSPLKDVYFGFDQYDLQPSARDTLKANADWLKANPSARVEIEGHCDERGTSEYNLALGAKRAQAAKDYLVTLGISAERLSTISYGNEVSVCQDHTEDCWQQNRHDRFVTKNSPTA
jgi:peptidoglycan-associated lipoprotein